MVPEAAFKQAITNLKAYCCTKVDPGACTPEEKKSIPENYPKSAFFFDQLLDVTMRRLDGVKSLAYNLEPDQAGKERRDYITQVANDPNPVQASTIESKYNEYRTWHQKNTKNIDKVIELFSWGNLPATFSLRDRYNTVCMIMRKVYESIQSSGAVTSLWWEYEIGSFFKQCKNLITERINRETEYVKLLMIKKSTQTLDESTKAYTQKYFVEEKLMALRNLVSKVKDMFQTVVQQAAASKSCSK